MNTIALIIFGIIVLVGGTVSWVLVRQTSDNLFEKIFCHGYLFITIAFGGMLLVGSIYVDNSVPIFYNNCGCLL